MDHTKKLKRFSILLDDESLLYFPGSFLTGKVVLEVDEDTPVTALYFHIIGESTVKLTTNKGKTLATDKENYIDFRMKMLGTNSHETTTQDKTLATDSSDDSCLSSSLDSDSDEDNDQLNDTPKNILILSPGVHTFPFKLGLPLGLPSTFLGVHGWIQYFCRAVLREPNGVLHKNQQVFLIINPIDLSNEPGILQQPFYCEAEEKVTSARFGPIGPRSSAGSLFCKVRLDRGGYVPGESISISATIENASKVCIKKTRAVLAETVQYVAKNKIMQSETRELACRERGKIKPNSSDTWKRELLQIPALPPTNIRGCNLINIQYDVYFVIETRNGGSKKSVKLQLPIVMATYPVRNKDGTLKRRKGTSYPSSLPMLRHL